MIDAKAPKRYKATRKEWKQMRRYFEGDVCWCCGGRWTELHHILNRSHSGDDVVVNLAPLCATCHRLVEERDSIARAKLRWALLPSNLNYLKYRLGDNVEGWLERNYALAKAAA